MRRLATANAILAVALICVILVSIISTREITISASQVLANNQVSHVPDHFGISGYPNSVTAGQSFSGVVVTAYDSSGQVITSYNGHVYFASTDSKATLPYISQCTYHFVPGRDHGVHSFSGFNLITAGSQTITVTDGTVSATTASIKVNDASLFQLHISPKTATISAGSQQAYTATGVDYYGNKWDVTSSTSWSISTGASGSWSGNVYASCQSGSWTVIGNLSGTCDSAVLTVNHAITTKINLNPKSSTLTAGAPQSFNATAFDSLGNSWDVSTSTTWSISSGAGGTWAGNTCTATKTGTWIITGTYGSFSDSATLSITPAAPNNIAISPKNPTSAAGSSVTFNATAFDLYGNNWDVTGSTTWSTSSDAGGSWNGNIYKCAKVGIWTVTGSYGSLSSTTTLTVGYTNAFSVAVSPKSPTLTAGSSVAFNATASDLFGNNWDVTSSTIWNISSGAGGSLSGNTYTSSTAGTWILTGTYRGLVDTDSLTVSHGSATKVVVGSSYSSSVAGSSVTCTANAFDAFGNSWDVSSSTIWSISSGADGSWSGSIYTSAKAGTWTITGTYGTYTNTASLTVTHAPQVNLDLSPKNVNLIAGFGQTYIATASDQFTNNWDVSASTIWVINASAGGSWSANTYTPAITGTWTISGTNQGLTNSTTVSVTHGYATKIQVLPKTASVTAGLRIGYSTTAFDVYNNNWDAMSSATFSIENGAGGSFSGNTYTSCTAGIWSVTAISLGLSDTASLTVTHATAVQTTVNPNSVTIIAGTTQNYTATAYDSFNNPWDVSNSAIWNTSAGARGSWANNVYTSSGAGGWTVTAVYSGLTGYAYLTVNHASATNVQVSPKTAVMTAGSSESFSASSFDSYGNSWDVTSLATWNAGGGSWVKNTYTAATSGIWTVSASYANLSDTASLTVNPGIMYSIAVSPASSSILAGSNQSFTATASDSNGKKWNVTNTTNWSIDAGAKGVWIGNVYIASNSGNWTVTGTCSGSSGTAVLSVNHGSASSISLGTTPNSVIAGSSATFIASASDSQGNTWDATSSATWTIDPSAGGSMENNIYTSELAGVWNVTCVLEGLSKSAFLTVAHAETKNIIVNPYNANINSGSNEAYSATASDNFGNSWDVTTLASWSVSSNAGGSWSGNVYTSAKAGVWTITSIVGNLQSTTQLTVTHGSASSIVVTTQSPTINSGSAQTFMATAYDSGGNTWDIANSTMWTIDSTAGGSWSNNSYTAGKTGNWIVTGTLGSLSSSTALTVIHGSLSSVTINPVNASITMGSSQPFNATASDFSGNIWDITNSTTWQITSGAGGNWTENTYNSKNQGNWTITGTSSGISGVAQLTVQNPTQLLTNWLDLNHDGIVSIADILCYINAFQNYASNGTVDPTCDFNHDGQINFQDEVYYIMGYIAYMQTP